MPDSSPTRETRVAPSRPEEPARLLMAVSCVEPRTCEEPCRIPNSPAGSFVSSSIMQLGSPMSARWLDRPVHTRSFEHEGRSYVVRAFSSPDDPTRIKFEATADDRPVPIPGLPDGIMPLQ